MARMETLDGGKNWPLFTVNVDDRPVIDLEVTSSVLLHDSHVLHMYIKRTLCIRRGAKVFELHHYILFGHIYCQQNVL